MNRRQFLQRFAAVSIAAALVEPVARTIFLPPRGGWPVHDDVMDFTTDALRYKYTERCFWNYTNRVGSPAELSQASFERLLEQLKQHPEVIERPRLIVSPEFAQDEEFRRYARMAGYRV